MIKFGTDGWRGVISDDFTFQNVRLLANATAMFINERGDDDKGAVVGYDARFLSPAYASDFAAILAEQGIRTLLSTRILPTPTLTWAVRDYQAAWGIMITASHNPAEWNGVKLKTSTGGSALPEVIAELEKQVRKLEQQGTIYPKPKLSTLVTQFDMTDHYREHVRDMLNADLLSSYKGRIVFDLMHGAAQGYLNKLVQEFNLDLRIIRDNINPSFGGVNPEPVLKNLNALKDAINEHKADFGLATDGDGDRIAAIDKNGRYINAHQIIALLAKYLIEHKGWSGGIAESLTISELVKRVAAKYQMPTFETPVGFKYITDLMLTQDILVGGEEAGGIGIKNYLPERDGILVGFLLIEMCAAYQKPLGELLDQLMDEVGYYYYDRVDLHLTQQQKEKLNGALASAIKQIGSFGVKEIKRSDGVKLITDEGWVIFRTSGTEPIVRIYSEMKSEDQLQTMLRDARKFAEQP